MCLRWLRALDERAYEEMYQERFIKELERRRAYPQFADPKNFVDVMSSLCSYQKASYLYDAPAPTWEQCVRQTTKKQREAPLPAAEWPGLFMRRHGNVFKSTILDVVQPTGRPPRFDDACWMFDVKAPDARRVASRPANKESYILWKIAALGSMPKAVLEPNLGSALFEAALTWNVIGRDVTLFLQEYEIMENEYWWGEDEPPYGRVLLVGVYPPTVTSLTKGPWS